MVSTRTILKTLSANVAVAAATLTGGPVAGASMAAFLATPKGQQLLDFQVDNAAEAQGVELDDRARGGLVMQPTLGLTGEMGPEFVLPLMPTKTKRKPSAYQKRYKKNFRKIAPDYKLKSGRWKKNGFKRAVRAAHKMSKK